MPTYEALIALHKEGVVSFKHVITFNMDEYVLEALLHGLLSLPCRLPRPTHSHLAINCHVRYVGLPRDHPESYHSFMWNGFFKHVDMDPANAYILNGNAEDLVAECDAYEAKIAAVGGIELFLAGKLPYLTT